MCQSRKPQSSRPALRRFRESDGFSIIEILIVFALIGIAMLPLAGIQFGSREAVTEANRHADAVILGQAELEEMRSLGFGNVVPDTTAVGPYTIATATQAYIDPISGLPNAFVEELTVAIAWQDGVDRRTMTLSCLQARRR